MKRERYKVRFKNSIILGSLLVLMSFSVFNSCVKAPVKRFYTLVNDRPNTPKGNPAQKCSRSIVVAPVESISPYKDEKIIFRTDSYEVKHYNYRLWVSSPDDMMHSLLLSKLETARLFTAVETFVNASSRHLTLYGKLNALEELEKKGVWHGRLAMRFVVKDEQDENILWEYEFDETEPVKDENVPSLIHTLSEVYNKQTNKMIMSLKKFVTRTSHCQKEPADLAEPGTLDAH